MQKNYFIIGGVITLLLIGLFIFSSRTNRQNSSPNPLTPAASFNHSHGIAVDKADASKVYIATHEGLFLLKNDRDLFRIGKVRDDLMGFSPHPTDADTFFSSGHPARGGNLGFQKTTDGGVSWERVSAGLGGPVDFHAMAVSAANPSMVYGFFGGTLQRSADEGKSWEYTKGTIAPFSLSTHPQKTEIVYAATENGVMVSTDRGDTWSSFSPEIEGGQVSVFALSPDEPRYALAFAEKLGGLGKSTDTGAQWQKVAEDFGGETILYISFSKTEPSIVYALTDRNSVYKS